MFILVCPPLLPLRNSEAGEYFLCSLFIPHLYFFMFIFVYPPILPQPARYSKHHSLSLYPCSSLCIRHHSFDSKRDKSLLHVDLSLNPCSSFFIPFHSLFQSPKNVVGASALPTGKFLRVRKVFARIYKITYKM